MSFSNDKLRDTLEYCMMEGKALIIAGVEEDIDPMLTPVLEKQVLLTAQGPKHISFLYVCASFLSYVPYEGQYIIAGVRRHANAGSREVIL